MAVFRVERTRDYTVMSNHHLKNRSLSLKAKGLLSVMLSLPDEWDYTLRGLAAISKEGVDAIREAIRELEDAGYIVRSRGRNEKGQLSGTEYVIYEHPQQSADAPALDNPTQEKSVVADKPNGEPKSIKPLDFNTSKAISGSCETSSSSGKTPMWENPTLENPTLEKPTLEKKPSVKPKIRAPTPEQRYRQEENRCYKALSDYFHHLRTWKRQYAPQQPEDEWHPLFVEALQRESHIEYLLDVLLYGTAEEKKALVAEQRKEVIRLERRFTEHTAGHDRGRSQGKSGLDR